MENRFVNSETNHSGFDALQNFRLKSNLDDADRSISFGINQEYIDYHKIHKVMVGEKSVPKLLLIYESLRGEAMPKYLDTAAWAAAEAALISKSMSAVDRNALVERAEACWSRAIDQQEKINQLSKASEMCEDSAPFRYAVNLAFTPIMHALVAGNVTEVTREKVFVDVLSISQLAGLQRDLATKEGASNAVGDLLGLEHECNAHLVLLYMNDPRYIPLPSSARSGSGHDYPEQTHDIQLLNQHWGEIRKTIPIEIKSKASLRDIKRYEALIIRGKMHMSIEGKYTPEHTRNALAAHYANKASPTQTRIVDEVSKTLKELVELYQSGKVTRKYDSSTKFHSKDKLSDTYREYSVDRANFY